jgi:hypothetical protein
LSKDTEVLLNIKFSFKFLFLGEPLQAVPRVVVLDRPPPYIKVLSGSNVEFTWKFRVFEVKMMKAISWYYTFSADNWADHHKLVQKKFKANASSEVSGNPVLKRNRANCTFDFLNQIWTINCRLLNAKAYDSASYGMKVEFNGSPVINLNNTSSLNVIGEFKIFVAKKIINSFSFMIMC